METALGAVPSTQAKLSACYHRIKSEVIRKRDKSDLVFENLGGEDAVRKCDRNVGLGIRPRQASRVKSMCGRR